MIFLEILLEGEADVPAVKSILERRFNLVENLHFRIHPHRGKGRLPVNPLSRPDPLNRGLLDQLPAKLRGYHYLPNGYCVVVLVDCDRQNCVALKQTLVNAYNALPQKAQCVLFRIAVEETESWFLADANAIQTAYPRARISRLPNQPDIAIGAWEKLAEVLGKQIEDCDGSDKYQWASQITPQLDLANPRSPSLAAFINGIHRLVQAHDP
ncbi:MAG: DUF4276 family protein [Ignavibacteriales bacterium]|nr:DUF4276 family protein [Ignavibacteriales bacterium]